MIYTYTNTNQTVAVNAPVVFNINGILTGGTTDHVAGTSTVTIDKPGYYLVSFNGSGAATITATDPIEVTLYNNGDEVNGALSTSLSVGSAAEAALAFTTIIHVRRSCGCIDNTANLTVMNTGIAANYSNVALTITRL